MGKNVTPKEQYKVLGGMLEAKGLDIDSIKEQVKRFTVEVPTWIFGPFGGGRFGAYTPPGAARNVFEKVDDAECAAALTGAVRNVAIHTGWDAPEDAAFDSITAGDFEQLAQYCEDKGLGIGAVNPTFFLEGTHYGTLSAREESTRKRFIEHALTSCDVAAEHGHDLVTYWLPDGSNYPGQIDLKAAEARMRESLIEIYQKAPKSCVHLIEYKLFEPGTYSTVIQDAGIARDLAKEMGDRAGVLVDMGHHAFGVNIAQIVARLIFRGVRGGIHFNSRYAADDDHSVEPGLRMFEIFWELVQGEAVSKEDEEQNWAYMIDQCSGLENRMHAVLHSIDSLQVSLAKALIVDAEKLYEFQADHDIIRANRTLLDAFLTDVRPLVASARMENGGEADPVEAYAASGYQEKIEEERE